MAGMFSKANEMGAQRTYVEEAKFELAAGNLMPVIEGKSGGNWISFEIARITRVSS